jgi:pyruvate dehydrogenase E1 component
VHAGAYLLHDASEAAAAGTPVVNLFASGAVMPEALAAAGTLAGEGVAAHVVDVMSLDRLYRAWREALQHAISIATRQKGGGHLEQVIPHDVRLAPMVPIHDAATHAMAWLGSVFGSPVVPLGVDSFGQSGRIEDLYRAHDLLPGAMVNAALLALRRC